MGKSTKRRRQQRVAAVGAQVEESIRQDAEDKKLQHVGSTELFQLDSKRGDVPTRLAKKQKLLKLQKDPLLASSRKFDVAKLNKGEVLAVKKLQQQQQQMQPTEAMQQQQLTEKKKRKRKQEPATEIWCQDGRIKEDEQVQQLDEYVAPIIVKKLKQRKPVASTKYKVPTVEVAAAGQSYHPDFDTHQDVMAEAVAEELERREKTALQREPVSKGMSKETLQHIKEESSDSEAASDSDDEDDSMKKVRNEMTMRSCGMVRNLTHCVAVGLSFFGKDTQSAQEGNSCTAQQADTAQANGAGTSSAAWRESDCEADQCVRGASVVR